MSPRKAAPGGRRAQLLEALSEAARAHSTATVLFHASMAEEFGLSPTDTKALDLLERSGPMTAGELVERTGLASPSVTALIDRLESKGLARRVRDTTDRRRVIVELVPEGIRSLAQKFERLKDETEELWAPYSVEQLELIHDFLRRAAEFVGRRTSRGRG